MLKRFLIAATVLLAACQSAAPTETSIPTPTLAATSEVTSASPGWLETEMNGVSLGMWRPSGWETDESKGLVMAEHTSPAEGILEGGMLVYCFVPAIEEFDVVPDNHANFAWAVLDKVVKMPSHTGRDVAVSQPAGFDWGDFPAAYYLLTTGDGVRALVIALALPGERKVVVCNLSIPAAQAERIRAFLPQLFDGMMVDGKELDGEALNALPNPLPFPRYMLSASGMDNRVASSGTP